MAPQGRGSGCLVVLVAAGAWFFLLRDFTDTPITALLSALGALLVCGGAYLTLGGARHAFESLWYVGLCAVGLVMLAGAAATLAPAAPDQVLVRIPQGWNVLESRTRRLAEAIEAEDVGLARKLAARGLGDPAAPDRHGDSVLHRARSPEMVAALLGAGLDPDAAAARGQTLLMRTSDLELAEALLAGGADPNARDDRGFTALMHRRDDRPEMIEILLEAGADVHAANDSGRTVADLVRGPGRALLEGRAGGRSLVETGGVTPRGRDDWLVASPGPAGRPDASGVSRVGDPLRPGDVGSVSIVVDNPGSEDRVLAVRAALDGLLFVAASHDGGVETRGRPGPLSTVRWPLLSLPAGGQGRLEMQVLAPPDDAVPGTRAGDLAVDVTVVDLPERSERVLQLYQERAGAPARVEAGDPRAYAGAPLFAGVAFAFWLVYRFRARGDSEVERRYRFGRMVAGASAIVCVAVAADLTWSMVEPYALFDDASCEILDHRVLATEVQTSRTGRRPRRSFSLQAHPLAAVSIDTGTEPLVTAGWSTGAATHSVQELRAAPIGSTVPCWIDPDDPRRFTLVRTPRLAGVVGIAMLLGLAPVLGLIATRLGWRSNAPTR